MGGAPSPRRLKAIEDWRSLGLNVKLVTEEDALQLAHDRQIELHPGFERLSAVHKSDYLRSQFMFKFGGLYTDVKPPPPGVTVAFQNFLSSGRQAAGYAEKNRRDVPRYCSRWVRLNWRRLAGNGYFAFTPHTDFALNWMERVSRVMDKHLVGLQDFDLPHLGRGPVFSEQRWNGYPLRWAELQGEVFHQLQADFRFPVGLSFPYPIVHDYL